MHSAAALYRLTVYYYSPTSTLVDISRLETIKEERKKEGRLFRTLGMIPFSPVRGKRE